MTGCESILVCVDMSQVEVSSPCEDDLGRVRQITLEKDALAQQRAQAERAKQVSPPSYYQMVHAAVCCCLPMAAGSLDLLLNTG